MFHTPFLLRFSHVLKQWGSQLNYELKRVQKIAEDSGILVAVSRIRMLDFILIIEITILEEER